MLKCFDFNYLQKYENNPFIYERKSQNEENIYSYKTVLQEAAKCVEYLQTHQIKSHVGIAIDLREHSPATCVLLLGILNHQCYFYCLNCEETQDVATYLQSSGVKYIISHQNLVFGNILSTISNQLKIMDTIFHLYIIELQNIKLESKRICYTIATSGSTGVQKIVHVPFECLEPNIIALSQLLKIQENDMIFLASPPTFDPFVVEFCISLQNGSSILITSRDIRLQPQQLLTILFPELSSKRGVTIYQTTPSLFRLFDSLSIQEVILSNKSSLRCLILGGEEFPSRLELNSWIPMDFCLTGKRIFNIYGITEVSCWSTIYEYDPKIKSVDDYRTPLGKPLDDYTFCRLVDESGMVLGHNDCKGELEIGSSTRCCFIPQYETDIKILESNETVYRKTGDLVERDSTGNIYYIGRTNNTVKRFGKRLCLDFLNKKVEKLLNTNNMYYKVTSMWHKECKNLVFYFVNNRNILSNDKEYVMNALKENLDDHEKPDKIVYGKEFPLNHHGKLDRNKILEQILLANNTPTNIFKNFLTNILGLQFDERSNETKESINENKRIKLSKHLSFSKAGGTSFQALSLASELSQQIEEYSNQRKILEMLLDNNITIEDILTFLKNCSNKFKIEKSAHECLKSLSTNCNLKLSWRIDLKKCIDATPSIYEEQFVAVGSHSHLLRTVNAATGEEISCLELNDRIECPVVFVTSQLALVGCYDGFLYGFNFNNGTILWKLNARGMIKAKPLATRNKVIIASYAEDYNILAFDLKNLTLIWSLKLGSKGIFSSPVQITGELVLFCGLDGTYALVEIDTGFVKWTHKLDTPIFSTATKIQTSTETMLALADVKGNVSICKVENGEKIASFQTEGNIFSGFCLYHPEHGNNVLIIFGCYDKNIYCLKLEYASRQLSLFYKLPLKSAIYATPILISNRYILACSTKGFIALFNVHNASILASFDLKAEIFSSPSCLWNKCFYVGSRDNYLYAFQIET